MRRKKERLKLRAKAKGVPFRLSGAIVMELSRATQCPCCDVEMTSGTQGSAEVSIDRIVPHLGYTEENTASICRQCNELKSDMDVAGLRNSGLVSIADWVQSEISKRSLRARLAPAWRRALGDILIKFGRWMRS